MRKQIETEVKVGLFITIGLSLIMTAIVLLGGTENLFSRKNRYISKFPNVDGLIVGSKVILGGVPIGTVEVISFDDKERKIVVTMTISRSSADWIRKDSTAEIATQGVLGDKYININIGTQNEPTLQPGSEIQVQEGHNLSKFLSKGDQLVVSLNSIATTLDRVLKDFDTDRRSDQFFKGISATAKNLSSVTEKMDRELDQIQLKKGIGHLAQILEKINNGSGTIGALVNDPGLYDEIKALFGGVNRNRIMRNLVRQAIRDSEIQNTGPTPTPSPAVH